MGREVFGDIYVKFSVSCVLCPRPGLAPVEKDGYYEGLVESVLGGKAELLVHNLLSLAIASVAIANRIRTSAVLVPSLVRVAPMYLKLVTISSFVPFIYIY
ncbi:hypothetical protein DPMN_077946 [Dreissena polymorpha]|uniref:Uncharacterized protein n=1 Tax=Dreissena polymorpha TaxID=45954 RepID=A0A9D4BPS5_DREPO|nr:hypothetical protein DPMN_077946 [Dreissena polymorpha]